MNISHHIKYAIILVLTIILGLGSRAYSGPFQEFIHLYLGDVLYSTLYYFGLRWLGFSPRKALITAIAFCFAIEFLQLVHTPFLEKIRHTIFGKLVLGAGFLWSDLVCYSIGGCLGFFIDKGAKSFGLM